MTNQPEETTEPTENERFYDEVLGPGLKRLAEQAMERGMGFIATTEYEKGCTVSVSINIGPDTCNTLRLMRILSNSRGDLDLFMEQCMRHFNLSDTRIGTFMALMEAESELARARKAASNG